MSSLPTIPPGSAPAGTAANAAVLAAQTGGLSLGRCLALALGWAALLVALALAVDVLLTGPPWLTARNFGNWDAEHYRYIAAHGYDVLRTAFFPLFPWLWRGLGVDDLSMGLVNAALFVGAFAGLAWQFRWSGRQQLVLLSVPSLLFMALPYSEAVFFVSGALVLVGLRRDATGLYCLGLGLSCLSRSAAFVLVPAVLATAVLAGTGRWGGAEGSRRRGQALAGGAAALLGLGLTVLVQYRATGRWFVFFEAQQHWDNRLRWPSWPLTNWGGSFPTCFEGPAFAVGVVAALSLGWLGWQRLGQQAAAAEPLAGSSASAPVVFSLAYVAGITAITLATKGGVLVSLSRYVYATPYFLLLLATYLGRVRLTGRQLLGMALALELGWLAFFRAFGHIRTLGNWTLVTAAVLLYLANAHQSPRVRRAVYWPTVAGGTALLLLLLFRFLRHEWVA